MRYKRDWNEAQERFLAWWAKKNTGRPLLHILARRERPLHEPYPVRETSVEGTYTDAERMVARVRNHYAQLEPLAEAMPWFSMNLGAGSMALYLGSKPLFTPDTIWFEPTMAQAIDASSIALDKNPWLERHLEMYRQAKALLAGDDIRLCIPDLVEGLDILSALRGPQALCMDLYDRPDDVLAAIQTIDDCYMPVYDRFLDIVRDDEGGSSFTAYQIWGKGRTVKFQCDFSAMISPEQLQRFFVVPTLERLCAQTDHRLYHLDGPDCIRHIPKLMAVESLDALQWVPGDGQPLPGESCWDHIFRAVKDAGKGVWITLTGYEPDVAFQKADRLVRSLGADRLYLLFPEMSRRQADALLIHADRHWRA